MEALTLGLLAALAWGLHDLLVRRISHGPNVLGQILTVMIVGALVLTALALRDTAGLSAWAAVCAALAGVSYVVASIGLYRAFGLAPARVVSPVLAAYPLLSLLIAAAQGEPVTLSDWAAVTMVVAGVALVAALADGAAQGAGSVRVALLWAGLGAAGFAATFALGQAASLGHASLAAGAVTRVVAMICTAGLILWQRPSMQPVRSHWRLLLLMGLLDTGALGLVMLAGGMDHAEYAAVAASLFGVVTIVLAWRFLGETVRPAQWLGIGLVFAGIAALAV